MVNTRRPSSAVHEVEGEGRVGQLRKRTTQLGEALVRRQHSRMPLGLELGPVEARAVERRRVLRVGHVALGPSRSAANSRAGPA